jgi:hypothetical protein
LVRSRNYSNAHRITFNLATAVSGRMVSRFLRTDRDGEGTALTDGQTLEVHTFAEAHPH